MPSCNLLAPYGTCRVPPPATNVQGTSGTYYNRAAPTGAAPGALPGVPLRSSSTATGQNAAYLTTDESLWKPTRKNAATAPAYRGAATGAPNPAVQPAAYVASNVTSGGTEARTAPAEPARFRPAADATAIPIPASNTAASTAAVGSGLVVSSAQASDTIKSSSDASPPATSTLHWRSRGP